MDYSNGLTTERQAHYHRLLAIHRANLDRLEEQKAQYGLNVPIDLHSAVAHEKKAIDTLTLMVQSVVPTSLVSEVGVEGLILALQKQLDRQDAAFRDREMIDSESRRGRQRKIDMLLGAILVLVFLDIVMRIVLWLAS